MIEIYADNRVQFDGSDMTWALRRSGSVTVQNGKLTVPAARASVVALTGEVGKVAVRFGGNHNSRTFSVLGHNGQVAAYFVFEEVDNLSRGRSLLETSNGKGETTFSSELYPLKTLMTIDHGQPFSSDRSTAYIQNAPRIIVIDVTDYPPQASVSPRVNSVMRATNRMSGSSFWLGI